MALTSPFDDAKALVLDADLGAIAREDRDVVARFERLGHDLTSRSAGSAEHQELHDGRILTPSRHGAKCRHRIRVSRYHFRPMTRPRLAALAVAAALASSVHAQAPQYRARLSIVPIDIAMQSDHRRIRLGDRDAEGHHADDQRHVQRIEDRGDRCAVHRSPRTAMRGAPIGDLTATAETSGTISGSIELTKEQIDDLAAGRLYVQLHSQKAPDGNLWGWLLVAEKK